jgi:hypothetical protein
MPAPLISVRVEPAHVVVADHRDGKVDLGTRKGSYDGKEEYLNPGNLSIYLRAGILSVPLYLRIRVIGYGPKSHELTLHSNHPMTRIDKFIDIFDNISSNILSGKLT